MGWFRDHLFVISLSVFLVSVAVSVLIAGFGGMVILSALLSGSLTVDFLLGLWPYIPVLALLFTTTVLSSLGMGWSIVSRLSVPSLGVGRVFERLHPAIERLEQKNATLASLSLAERVAPPEPSDAEKLQRLKQQYVDGTIDEAEFERRVEHLTTADHPSTPIDTRVRDQKNEQIERER